MASTSAFKAALQKAKSKVATNPNPTGDSVSSSEPQEVAFDDIERKSQTSIAGEAKSGK